MTDPDKLFSIAETNRKLEQDQLNAKVQEDLLYIMNDMSEETSINEAVLKLLAEVYVAGGGEYKEFSSMVKKALFDASMKKYGGSKSQASKSLNVNRGAFRFWENNNVKP